MKNNQHCFVLFSFFLISIAAAQPQWVRQQKIENATENYFGIGVSRSSTGDADARALISFGQNVEVKVKSIFQREVTEEGTTFSDNTSISEELVSDVSLKGVAITERYTDTTGANFYSLVCYRKTEYDSLVTFEIQREILLMKARNKMIEEKRQEELRAQKTLNLQEEEKRKEELRTRQTQIDLEREQRRQNEERKKFYIDMYGEFLQSATPEKAVTLRNGEITHESSTLMVKGGVAPLQFNGGFYALRFTVFELSGNALFRNGKFNQQEGFVKVQILPGVGEISKTSIAIGISQAVGLIADSGYNFKRSKYSFFAACNYTDPEWYFSTISAFGDKRKVSLGVASFPFYGRFKNHLGFVFECNYFIDKDFRNKYGDTFTANGGIRLQASDNFSTQFAYENNEQFNLTFEFQF